MPAAPALPFTLAPAARGGWIAVWPERRRLRVYVVGEAAGPDAALLATLHDLIARWDDVCAEIAAFLRSFAADAHVPLEGRVNEGFAAGNCGFAEAPWLESLSVQWLDEPGRAEVTFCTGEPDGYVTYRVRLDRGTPVALSSFAS